MKFEDRSRIAKGCLVGFLDRFSTPRGLTDDAQAQVITSIADALARKLPVTNADEFKLNIEKTFVSVADSHKGYAWPPQSEFVDAVPRGQVSGRTETYVPEGSPHDSVAKSMANGEPVAEAYVWGRFSEQMLSAGDVSRDVMDGYRRGSVAAFEGVYGRDDAAKALFQKFGAVSLPYLNSDPRQSAAE